jgi:hypothetical protein
MTVKNASEQTSIFVKELASNIEAERLQGITIYIKLPNMQLPSFDSLGINAGVSNHILWPEKSTDGPKIGSFGFISPSRLEGAGSAFPFHGKWPAIVGEMGRFQWNSLCLDIFRLVGRDCLSHLGPLGL